MSSSKLSAKNIKDLLEEFDSEELEVLNGADVTATGLKSGLGLIPGLGSFLGEVVTIRIPNQRLDRVVRFNKTLAERLSGLEEEFIRSRFAQPGVLDIYAEGARQAANAYTEEKIAHIVTFVEKSITAEEVDVLKTMSIARILEMVNHVEIIILRHCALGWRDKKEFEEKYPDIFLSNNSKPKPELGNPKYIEQKGFIENCYVNLDSLGLIYMNRRKSHVGGLGSNQITIMGAKLLHRLGYEAKSSYTYQELIAKEASDASSSLRRVFRR